MYKDNKQNAYVSPFSPADAGGKGGASQDPKCHPTVIPAIYWNGCNLDEVVRFCGNSELWKCWFGSWSAYETYVRDHGDVFKIFTGNGAEHYEVPKDSWIVRTPEGVCHALDGILVKGI